ncbi:hypothetical protein NKJ40_07130 [Mesorhizobium sp. M0119]|uniref:hypothetical protein n=1 Tax=Mesorhizobium sp. M0119 TaxID=2956885 RepID=UPI00333DA3E3
MYAIDLAYTKYETSLTTNEQSSDLVAAATNIALTTTSSLISPVSTKNILSGVASALSGTKAVYNEKVLLRNSIQLLQTQMRANREMVASRLIQRLGQDDINYPLPLALSDLEEYYRAGTITAAMLKAQSVVSDNELIAEQVKQSVIVYNLGRGSGQIALRNALTVGGKLDPVLYRKIQAKLASDQSVETLISDPKLGATADRIARELGYI